MLHRLAEINDSYLRSRLPRALLRLEWDARDTAGKRQSSSANIEHVKPGDLGSDPDLERYRAKISRSFIDATREADLPAIDHPEIDSASMTLTPGRAPQRHRFPAVRSAGSFTRAPTA